jgi:hypothetical protein
VVPQVHSLELKLDASQAQGMAILTDAFCVFVGPSRQLLGWLVPSKDFDSFLLYISPSFTELCYVILYNLCG